MTSRSLRIALAQHDFPVGDVAGNSTGAGGGARPGAPGTPAGPSCAKAGRAMAAANETRKSAVLIGTPERDIGERDADVGL